MADNGKYDCPTSFWGHTSHTWGKWKKLGDLTNRLDEVKGMVQARECEKCGFQETSRIWY